MFRKYLILLSNAIFPKRCFVCKSEGFSICLKCLRSLSVSNPEKKSRSLFSYSDRNVRKLIHRIKYYNDQELARDVALYLSEQIIELISENFDSSLGDFLLVPIPISKNRHKARGYNQTVLIAKEVASITNIPVTTNTLIKIKDTPPQARIRDRKKRLKNIKDSFGIRNHDCVRNKDIILIDDVTTTGATLMEAKRVLLKAGAHRVLFTTIAS